MNIEFCKTPKGAPETLILQCGVHCLHEEKWIRTFSTCAVTIDLMTVDNFMYVNKVSEIWMQLIGEHVIDMGLLNYIRARVLSLNLVGSCTCFRTC